MFDKKYFDDIWQGVHRHDYCNDLADLLITKYGKVKILDIGTGCGELVRVLREKGCDAWGLEISEYAVGNSHGFVRLGDVRDIPFASGFDVVFSQGLWEYIPEDDIDKAWVECKRVGKFQEHNFDSIDEDNLPEHQKITIKSREWWKNKFYPKVLIACPTHELKEYAMQAWIDCVNKINYPNFDILVVDNSPNEDFYNRWKDKINMIHLPDMDQSEVASARINASMQVIQKTFLLGDYKWWFNLEVDVIVEPEALNILLKYPSDWTSHGYKNRGGGGWMTGIGCSLLSRSIAEAGEFTSNVHGPDAVLWEQTMYSHTTISLTKMIEIDHIGKGNGYGG